MSELDSVFATCRAEGRAALVGYLPAGYPTVADSIRHVTDLVAAGCDIVEVGVPYSDPVMDGPTIQAAAEEALVNGFRVKDVFDVVAAVKAAGGEAVVMSYWNPILQFGVADFARELKSAGGCGIVTPNLIPEESQAWLAASEANLLDRIYLVAPSSSPERIALTCAIGSGFIYAASTMGVTGARDAVSSAAPELVRRVREVSSLPIGVGLGVKTREQAAEIAGYADAVIVGSALVSAAADGTEALRALTAELAAGVRG